MKKLLLVLTLIFIGTVGYYWTPISVFFDRTPPEVALTGVPKGLGQDEVVIGVQAKEIHNTVDSILLRVEQGGRRTDIGTIKSSKGEFRINAKDLLLREGEVTITAVAFDNAFFSNKGELSITLPVDFRKSRVEIITPMQNVNQGGIELVFFLVTGSPSSEVGVRVGEEEYKGFQAGSIDKRLSAFSNLYFSFFAIPAFWSGENPYVFARNSVGAETRINFPYRVIRRKFPKAPINLSEAFLTSATEKLSKAPGSKIEQFKWINETYRAQLKEKLHEILSVSEPNRSFETTLQRPMAGSNRSSFFEQREYLFNKEIVSESVHEGIDLAGTAMMPVVAAASGKVVFADDFGIYGNTVIIDHGIGIFTLYGHLSSILVKKDDRVASGSRIGLSGDTGLAGGDHLHFEVRLFNTSVNPIEWWDARWMEDHITAKINFVEEQMRARAALEAAIEAQ